VAAVCGLLLSACGPSGISREEAITLALAEGGPQATVISVAYGSAAQFKSTVPASTDPNELVWAVRIAGQFSGSCVVMPGGQSRCPADAGSAMVVLDASTGELVGMAVPG
jgi:hypothetical protein